MKTRLLLLFLIMTLMGWSAQGQSCECQTDFLDISTGLDHSTGQYYNPGDPDLYWTVTSDPSGGPTPRPADVVSPDPNWAPGNPQKWISPFNTPPGFGAPSGTFILETTFCVCETTDLIFNFSTLVDDDVTITLNDNLGAVMQVLQTASGFSTPTNTSTLVTGVPPGSYTVVANLSNFLSAVGLNINGSIVGPGLTLRECCQPVQPDPCGEVVMETITNDCAEPWNYDYSFHIQNNVTNLAVTDVLFLNPTPGFTITPNFQTSLNIPPNGGVSGTLNTVITANPQLTQNTQLCFTVVLLSNGATCCEFEHCITLTPPDDPCDDVSLFVKQDDCCFNVDVTNNYCEDYFTGIRTTALSSGTTFNTLNGGSNWNFTANGAGTQVLWEPINGHVDLGVTDDLQFCLSGASGVHQVVFEWLALDQDGNEIVVCTETRELACDTGCLTVVEDTIICNDDGTFTFVLTVTNQSNINIATDIYLSPFMGSPILFTPAVFTPINPIPPGGSFQITTTVTNVNNLPAGSPINYQIILLDLNTGWCCHQNDLIFTVPDCEGCDCGSFDDFQADLNAGFTLIDTDCDNLSLTPNAAQDCDLVIWDVRDLSTGMTVASGQSNGSTPWIFSVPGSGQYQICMVLIRFDANGDFCFEGQYCEEVEIDCGDCECGSFDDFQADLNAGFTLIDTDCDNLSLTPNAAQDCDLVIWDVRDLSTGMTVASGQSNGSTPWIFSVPGSGQYQICMVLIRFDANGDFCFEGQYCEEVEIDCGDCECGTEDEFQADLNAGFTVTTINCSNIVAIPNSVQDCDVIYWSVSYMTGQGVASGQTTGTNPWTFALPGTGVYNICMTIVRFDANGNFCFEGQYCEKTGINCDPAECIDLSLIDPSISCPPRNRLDYVCGCDGRTYTNSCVAKYRNGITSWVAGPCAGGGIGGGILLNGDIVGGAVLLNFSLEPENTFVEYVIERKIGSEDEWEEIGVIGATGELTYEFFDDAPATGTNEYQVLAITETGLIEFSNTVLVEFENGDLGRSAEETGGNKIIRSVDHQIQHQTQSANTTTILVYPNPSNTGVFQVELPTEGFTSWSLLSTQGKVVRQQDIDANQGSFTAKVGDLPPGMYILQVNHQDMSKTDRIKVVIQ